MAHSALIIRRDTTHYCCVHVLPLISCLVSSTSARATSIIRPACWRPHSHGSLVSGHMTAFSTGVAQSRDAVPAVFLCWYGAERKSHQHGCFCTELRKCTGLTHIRVICRCPSVQIGMCVKCIKSAIRLHICACGHVRRVYYTRHCATHKQTHTRTTYERTACHQNWS